MPRPVIVVKMRDQAQGHVGRLDPRPLHHGGGGDVVPHPALLRLVVEEAGVDEHGLGAAEDEPDEVVEGELVVRRLAVEELALRGVPFRVLEGVDLVHVCPPRPGSLP